MALLWRAIFIYDIPIMNSLSKLIFCHLSTAMRKKFSLFIIALMAIHLGLAQTVPPFRDTQLSFEKRVDDLLSRLTLEEKVKQMMHTAPAIERLNIPAYNWWNEVLHGVARTPYHTTSYPQAIGMAATWDTNSLRTMADYSAMEGRAIHNIAIKEGKTGEAYLGLTYWTPNINIFRDPRWGRGQETYGEDPFLTAMLGKAFVHGLQGDDPRYLKAAACAKHFAVHSGPESTRHSDNIIPSLYDLWDTYLPAFKELVVNAKVAGVMCAYNAVNTQPCCANDLLMNDILRHQWNFTGYVTSDCWAVDDFFRYHKTHKDATSSAIDALIHGTDVECGNSVYIKLLDAVKDGSIKEMQLDISLRRLFMIRFRLGMFDPPEMVPFANAKQTELESAAHKEQALKMARQSIVLLKNQDHLLPLSKKIKKIALLGPNADNKISILGNYNGTPSRIYTVLDGLKDKLGDNTEIYYEKAISFTNDTLVDLAVLKNKLSQMDLIIFAGGISPELEGEEMPVKVEGFSGGDRTSIKLPANQTRFMKWLKSTGKPVVFVMMTGSALAIPWEAENIPAIINGWYGGQSAGTAIADVLFGDYIPAGRLPVSFYRSDKDLPEFSNYSMEGRTYRYFKGETLFPFGYGLSYTKFHYGNLKLPATLKKGTRLNMNVSVTNTGKFDGEEVVEIYVSHQGKKLHAPIRALKGFQRISLRSGESRLLHYTLTAEDLSLVDENGHAYEPEGSIMISVGGGQPGQKIKMSSNVVSQSSIIL